MKRTYIIPETELILIEARPLCDEYSMPTGPGDNPPEVEDPDDILSKKGSLWSNAGSGSSMWED